MSVLVSVTTQTFSTLYLAALVLITQRLALIRDLHTRQTLTAIHDKASAWLGLGSSLFALWDQKSLCSSALGVILIGLYWAGIAVLHIIIPASVSVTTYNATVLTQQTTRLARSEFPQIGLEENMIYDILPVVPTAVNNATVNATVFEAHCGVLSQNVRVKPHPHFKNISSEQLKWIFETNFTELRVTANLSMDILAPGTLTTYAQLQGYDYADAAVSEMLSNVIPVVSTIPVVDASQSMKGTVKFNPGVAWYSLTSEWKYWSIANSEALVDSVQIFLCNVSIVTTTIEVSAITRRPFKKNALPAVDVLWKNWSFRDYPATAHNSMLNLVQESFSSPPPSTRRVAYNNLASLYNTTSLQLDRSSLVGTIPTTYSLIDQFLMEDLNYTDTMTQSPTDQLNASLSRGISLSDLQHSLGKAVAAMMWYGGNKDQSSTYTDGLDSSTLQRTNDTGKATVEVLNIRLRLNFNILLSAVGLGVSCVLFALTFLLSSRPKGQEVNNDLNSAGILQLTWLLGNESRFAGIRRPDRQELRRAGLFDVQMSTWAKHKTRRDSSEYESSELTMLNASQSESNFH
ncbi:hypothetical protein BC629DRAFT_1525131 [Irpex lacteus]|nr:hypothetical protein BC629DRAFT_1525131 [Irpex lacteus]